MKLFERTPGPPVRPGITWHAEPRIRNIWLRLGWWLLRKAGRVLALLARVGWRWRVEVLTVIVLAALGVRVHSRLGEGGVMVLAAALLALLGCAPCRAALLRVESRARLRRRWTVACRHAGLETFNERLPRIKQWRGIELTPAGELLRVRVPNGRCASDLARSAEVLAVGLAAREVQVALDGDDARRCQVMVIRRDPLAGTVEVDWPNLDAAGLSLWEPVPVGVDEHGQPVTITLPYRNLLIGGEPGAGKSAAASMIVATAALDPSCRVWLLDGKQVELAFWRDLAATYTSGGSSRTAFVGPDLDAAIDLLGHLQAEMDRRYERLLDERQRKIEPGDGYPLDLVVIDELAFYTAALERKARDEFNARGRDVTARGRAVGIMMLAATQKPSRDTVPSAWRDLFGFRWALRCSTRDASDTILGSGWATNGYSAGDIAGDQRGVGYLLAEGEVPQRIRSYYLTDTHVETLAARGQVLRSHVTAEPRCPHCAGVIDLDHYRDHHRKEA